MVVLKELDFLSDRDMFPAAVIYGAGAGVSVIVAARIKSVREVVLHGTTRDVLVVGVSWGLGAATSIYLGARLLKFWNGG
jgi:hypothetical protein